MWRSEQRRRHRDELVNGDGCLEKHEYRCGQKGETQRDGEEPRQRISLGQYWIESVNHEEWSQFRRHEVERTFKEIAERKPIEIQENFKAPKLNTQQHDRSDEEVTRPDQRPSQAQIQNVKE